MIKLLTVVYHSTGIAASLIASANQRCRKLHYEMHLILPEMEAPGRHRGGDDKPDGGTMEALLVFCSTGKLLFMAWQTIREEERSPANSTLVEAPATHLLPKSDEGCSLHSLLSDLWMPMDACLPARSVACPGIMRVHRDTSRDCIGEPTAPWPLGEWKWAEITAGFVWTLHAPRLSPLWGCKLCDLHGLMTLCILHPIVFHSLVLLCNISASIPEKPA